MIERRRWLSLARSLGGLATPRGPRVTIVTYHAVSDRPDPHAVSPAVLRRHMEFFRERYTIIRIGEIPSFLDDDASVGHRLVITFDDGYRDFLESAYPVLDSLSIPCTMFVPTGLLGRFNRWDAVDGRAPKRPIMTPEEIRTLDRTPSVEIGSHTVNHVRMSRQPPDGMRSEAIESRRALEALLGRSVTTFAYPYGQLDDFSSLTRAVLREAGYTSAVTTHWGTNHRTQDRLALKRIWLCEDDTLEDVSAKVDGRDDWRGAKERVGYALRQIRRVGVRARRRHP